MDDLDLDTDVATSVTVVEWGEGLVEDLAPSFLQVAISAAAAGADPGSEDDELRTVRVLGWGERWRDAAPAARRAVAGRVT